MYLETGPARSFRVGPAPLRNPKTRERWLNIAGGTEPAMIISNFCPTGPRMATRSGTIEAIAGNDQIRAAQVILLAGLWHDDLGRQVARQVKARLFTDDLLRSIAAYSVDSLSSFGVTDLATVDRMLRERFPDQAVSITTETIGTLVELIEVDDVREAIELLTNTLGMAA